jgi:hypothetical protein
VAVGEVVLVRVSGGSGERHLLQGELGFVIVFVSRMRQTLNADEMAKI